jgi:cytochrome c oxidase cbb3-type subunit III
MKRIVAIALVSVVSLAGRAGWAQPPQQTAPGGGGAGGRGVAPGGGRRGPNFPQQTRKLASPEVIARGKAVYSVNCTGCHGTDLRGGDQGGPSLLRSLVALSDQHGESIAPILHGARQDKGMPAFNFTDTDVTAVAEFVHSVLASVGSQARPPGAIDPSTLNVLVGNASAGHTYFQAKCAGCHSAAGDLNGIAAKYPEARTLQNTWVSGGGGGGRFGRGGGGEGEKPSTVTVTLADGQKVEGVLIRGDDFIVTLRLADGTRRSIARNGDEPTIRVHDPYEAHKRLAPTLDDKDMHDVTAYLATLK